MEKQILELAFRIMVAVNQWDRGETPCMTKEQIRVAVSNLNLKFARLWRKPTKEEKKAFKELDFAVYNSISLD